MIYKIQLEPQFYPFFSELLNGYGKGDFACLISNYQSEIIGNSFYQMVYQVDVVAPNNQTKYIAVIGYLLRCKTEEKLKVKALLKFKGLLVDYMETGTLVGGHIMPCELHAVILALKVQNGEQENIHRK